MENPLVADGDEKICSRECWKTLADAGEIQAKVPCAICGCEAEDSGWGGDACSRKCWNTMTEPSEEEEEPNKK